MMFSQKLGKPQDMASVAGWVMTIKTPHFHRVWMTGISKAGAMRSADARGDSVWCVRPFIIKDGVRYELC